MYFSRLEIQYLSMNEVHPDKTWQLGLSKKKKEGHGKRQKNTIHKDMFQTS